MYLVFLLILILNLVFVFVQKNTDFRYLVQTVRNKPPSNSSNSSNSSKSSNSSNSSNGSRNSRGVNNGNYGSVFNQGIPSWQAPPLPKGAPRPPPRPQQPAGGQNTVGMPPRPRPAQPASGQNTVVIHAPSVPTRTQNSPFSRPLVGGNFPPVVPSSIQRTGPQMTADQATAGLYLRVMAAQGATLADYYSRGGRITATGLQNRQTDILNQNGTINITPPGGVDRTTVLRAFRSWNVPYDTYQKMGGKMTARQYLTVMGENLDELRR